MSLISSGSEDGVNQKLRVLVRIEANLSFATDPVMTPPRTWPREPTRYTGVGSTAPDGRVTVTEEIVRSRDHRMVSFGARSFVLVTQEVRALPSNADCG